MKIEFNKNQYKTLLTMMYCGEWMLNSHKTDDDIISKESEDLEQLIFSYAKDFGFKEWIEYDVDLKKFFPTADMEDDLHINIDKYNKRQKGQ
jgi:hypothetical protein